MSDVKTIEHVHLVASRPVWGVIAALFGLLVAIGGYWGQSVNADQKEIGRKVERLAESKADTEGRLRSLESSVDAVREGQRRQEEDTRVIRRDVQRILELLAAPERPRNAE